jgi:hypothetical protein
MQDFRFGSVERPLVVTCSGGGKKEPGARIQEPGGCGSVGEWACRRMGETANGRNGETANRRVGEKVRARHNRAPALGVGAISEFGTAAG